MGVSVAEGTLVQWHKQVGDHVDAEETVCEISTDKIDTEIPAPVAGIVAEILVAVQSTVAVGVVLARIATGGRRGRQGPAPAPAPDVALLAALEVPPERGAISDPALEVPPERGAISDPALEVPSPTPGVPESGNSGHATAGGRRGYSPVVQRVAAEHGIDLERVPGTGRDGRVRKQDVLAFLDAAQVRRHAETHRRPAPAPDPSSASADGVGTDAESGQLSRIRRQIGERMKSSLQSTAQCTTWIEVDMGAVESARARRGLTALPYVASASVAALHEHPTLNAWLEGERQHYTRHDGVNLGIAVSLGDDGLIVPVIDEAQTLSVDGLSARIKALAARARARELTPDEVRGATFTITNPGQFGSIMATPIINQPQVAILDFEAVVKRVVVVTDAAGDDAIAIRSVTILGLSWDHRALDGAQAAQFLAGVKRRLEGWGGA